MGCQGNSKHGGRLFNPFSITPSSVACGCGWELELAPPAATSASRVTGEPGPLPERSPGVTGPALAVGVGVAAAVGLDFEFLLPLDFLGFMAPAYAETPGMNSGASGFMAFGSRWGL